MLIAEFCKYVDLYAKVMVESLVNHAALRQGTGRVFLQNIEFVGNKRDEVPFSPKDQQSVESFLKALDRDYMMPLVYNVYDHSANVK
ncbi:hypothetical protein D8674_024622 [Pyrus ussuriensis x Pyrus communis]|uniref:Uncharacterized protein n=1 Tax=Pyrus ussuriensis x Pyrus communis TaxID=2448454 RepID=A0A5N5HAI7_9ROSA|nr:hypothetical protein D8674_024622 [Pyrus ussuriensis x Pyrus communis]